MNHWVMDYETLVNCFVGVFEHYKTSERKIFIVHEKQNDFEDFIEFLKQNIEFTEYFETTELLEFTKKMTHEIF